jgi:hypothetical protein
VEAWTGAILYLELKGRCCFFKSSRNEMRGPDDVKDPANPRSRAEQGRSLAMFDSEVGLAR